MNKIDSIADWFFGWPFAAGIVLLFFTMVSIFGRIKTKPNLDADSKRASKRASKRS